MYFAGDDIDKFVTSSPPCIGPYDYWAIEYGYKPADKGGDEKAMLQQIASASAPSANTPTRPTRTRWA